MHSNFIIGFQYSQQFYYTDYFNTIQDTCRLVLKQFSFGNINYYYLKYITCFSRTFFVYRDDNANPSSEGIVLFAVRRVCSSAFLLSQNLAFIRDVQRTQLPLSNANWIMYKLNQQLKSHKYDVNNLSYQTEILSILGSTLSGAMRNIQLN